MLRRRQWQAIVEIGPAILRSDTQRMLYARIICLGLIILIHGCASAPPLRPAQYGQPQLVEIHRAFARAVRDAHHDPDVHWRSGWAGNIVVNMSPQADRGLCYQWQQLVYVGVLDTVKRVGWHANGIVINKGTRHEHHAVIVFDPEVTDQDHILDTPDTNPAWVLDAWRRGKADIFTVRQWTELPLFKQVPPKITGVIVDDQTSAPLRPHVQSDRSTE